MFQINKRSIGVCILLSIITLGIYEIYWLYLLVKNIRSIQKNTTSCTKEMLCLIFVPFYSLYWWYTRGEKVKQEFSQHNYASTGNGIVYLIFAIFGLSIVSMAIMQSDFNSLKSETHSEQQGATIEIKNLSKTFKTAGGDVEALKNVNIKVNGGDIYGIIGMSGAGKSTLVRCMNMLEKPSEGSVIIDGEDISTLGNRELREVRRKITMIFQSFNLLMQRNCLKNICFPIELGGVDRESAEARARELLEIVGLPDKAEAYPAQLSGGQQQRIAIARALATDPKILLCDEATSALDPKTTQSILSLIKDINKKMGITVIIITHQMSVVEQVCNRVAILDGGEVVEEGEVAKVFATPKSDAAKRLVFPESTDGILEPKPNERRIRVVFNGAKATGSPLIATMAVELGVYANILSASTKTIGEKAYGNMLLGIDGGEEQLKKAMKYLRSIEDIAVEETD